MELSKNFAEIERKFLLKGDLPLNLIISTASAHRCYLYINTNVELRIQSRGRDHYELERKILDQQSPYLRWSMKMLLTVGEFEKFQESAIGNSINYLKHCTNIPGIAIKEYQDQLAGLFVVETEFPDLHSLEVFDSSYPWIGKEISDLPYSRDSGLIYINDFQELSALLPVK